MFQMIIGKMTVAGGLLRNLFMQIYLTTTTTTTGLGFFSSTVDTLKTVVTAIGAGLAVWGVISLLEGYSQDNPAAKSQGIKQLMAGAGIIVIAQTVIPLLSTLF